MAANGRSGADSLLVLRIASGDTIAEAAAACGLSERTIYRRLKDDDFQAAVQELRAAFTSQAAGRLGSLYQHHVDAIHKMAGDETAPAGVRLAASKAVLELGLKLRSESDFERRLKALEDRAAAAEGGPPK